MKLKKVKQMAHWPSALRVEVRWDLEQLLDPNIVLLKLLENYQKKVLISDLLGGCGSEGGKLQLCSGRYRESGEGDPGGNLYLCL